MRMFSGVAYLNDKFPALFDPYLLSPGLFIMVRANQWVMCFTYVLPITSSYISRKHCDLIDHGNRKRGVGFSTVWMKPIFVLILTRTWITKFIPQFYVDVIDNPHPKSDFGLNLWSKIFRVLLRYTFSFVEHVQRSGCQTLVMLSNLWPLEEIYIHIYVCVGR